MNYCSRTSTREMRESDFMRSALLTSSSLFEKLSRTLCIEGALSPPCPRGFFNRRARSSTRLETATPTVTFFEKITVAA